MDLQLGAIREQIATNPPTGVSAHARPPGLVTAFPALIVHDPQLIQYRTTRGNRAVIRLPARLIVPRAGEERDAAQLDALVSTVPDQLAAIDAGGLWSELNVLEMAGGYFDWQQGGQVVGLGADLTLEIVTRNEVA